jgi:Leucine-rich repeat (LRR) protein
MDEFGIFEQAQTIRLSHNRFSTIPKSVLAMKQLTALDFSCNHFSAISSDIEKIKNLKFLSFKSNTITSVHPSIGFSRHLVSLDLSSNRISKLSDVCFFEMFQLASLFLQSNRFEIFPHEVFSATSLTQLNLAVNPFTTLPTQLILFKDIILTLDLHSITQPSQIICSQGLRAIFQWISVLNLTQASTSSSLDLTAYGLTQLPPELLADDSLKVTTIILKSNSIQMLPMEAALTLRNIRILDYSMNGLYGVPEVLFRLTNLEQLDLSSNNITIIPDQLVSVSTGLGGQWVFTNNKFENGSTAVSVNLSGITGNTFRNNSFWGDSYHPSIFN